MYVKINVWDREKEAWIDDELENLGREFGLVWTDMAGCAVSEDGTMLLDECGNHVYLDPTRFATEITVRPGTVGIPWRDVPEVR